MAESRYAYVSYIRSTPQTVWDALVSAEAMKAYFFGLPFEAELRAGGAWRRLFPDGALMTEGEFIDVEPPKRLAMSWRNAEPEKRAEGYSRCVMDLQPAGEATRLTVTQSVGVANSKLIAAVSEAWPQVISNLKSYLETGAPVLIIPTR
jgi:uncharacterized protein YndB with AHSA1/START domain